LLLKAGACVNQRKEIDASETPLMEAAYCGQAEMVRLLLEYGADPKMRETMQDRTPLEMARVASAGADPNIYEHAKNTDYFITPLTIIESLDLPPEQLELIKSQMKDFDMAEFYRDSANRIAQEGDHARVIRILQEHDEHSS
jgi:uncharacterized protein